MERRGVGLKPVANTTEARFERAIFYLDRTASRAIREFDLIRDGDRIVVGLSGGKDSAMLLHILARRRQWRRERYELLACHVRNPDEPEEIEPQLAQMCADLRVPLVSVDADPIPPAHTMRHPLSPCFLCARRRRKALFQRAVEAGYGVVALGHHMNDAAETLLLNLLWQGRCEGMLPSRDMFQGRIRLIRPLIYVEERELARACRLSGFPARPCSCSFADRSKREVAASVLETIRRSGVRGVVANAARASLRAHPEHGSGSEGLA